MYNTVETFESVDEMFKSEHLNKSIDQDFPVVLCASSSSRVCGWSPNVWLFQWKFPVKPFITSQKVSVKGEWQLLCYPGDEVRMSDNASDKEPVVGHFCLSWDLPTEEKKWKM